MASFSNIISITESDDLYSLSNKGGAAGYSDGTEDTFTWGDPIDIKNGKIAFSKKYLNLTFVIDRVAGADFIDPRNISINIEYENGTSSSKMIICENLDLNTGKDGVLIYGSRSTDATLPEKRALIRVQISTLCLYNIGKIKKIWCYIDYSDFSNPFDIKTYNISNNFWLYGEKANTTLYKGHKWYKGSFNTQRLTDSGTYSTTICGPSPDPRGGTIDVYSLTTDGTTKDFFTQENGEIIVKIDKLRFCSDSDNGNYYRYPSDYFFTGKGENGTRITEKISKIKLSNGSYSDLYTPGNENAKQISFKTSEHSFFKNFKTIEKIEICFGGDLSNKKIILEQTIPNIDLDENLSMTFSYANGGSNRINYISSISKNKVKLYSHIKGEISRGDLGYLVFSETANLELNKEAKTDNGSISITVHKNKLKINDKRFYDCEVNGDHLDFSNSSFVSGQYYLRCNVTNKLKVHSQTEYTRTFTISELIFSNTTEDKVALFGPTTSISRTITETTYTVPGIIIIRNEDLKFSTEAFEIFKIQNGEKEGNTIEDAIDYYVGLSNSSDYFIPRTNGNFTTNANPSSLSYTNLKDKYTNSYGTQNGQIKLTLGYYFNDSNIYSHTFSYILGRIEDFGIKSFQVDHSKNISYYLTDNGGDFIEAKNGHTQKTQNQFIDGRKNNEYFSLSRQPKNPEIKKAQERLRIDFISGTDKITKTVTVENDETLFTLLQLMKINTTNTISLDAFGFLEESSNPEELDVNKITNRRKINIKIAIDYIYEQKDKTDYYDELVSHTLENITFIQENFPIGLRQGGVIINPDFDEKIDVEKIITQEEYNALNEEQKKPYKLRQDGSYSKIEGRKNTFVINVKDIEKNPGSDAAIPKNGLKIVFDTGATSNLPTFEIYLGEDGFVHLSNCKIDEPPAATET